MVKPMKWTSYIKDKVRLRGSASTNSNCQTGSSSSYSLVSASSSCSPITISPTFPGPVREGSEVEGELESADSNARSVTLLFSSLLLLFFIDWMRILSLTLGNFRDVCVNQKCFQFLLFDFH